MTAIGQSLGEDVCKALPRIHALTGCDSTSAFVGKGKRQVMAVAYPFTGWTSSLHQSTLAIHQLQLHHRSLCRRHVFFPN